MLSILEYHRRANTYFQKSPAVWQFFANHTHKEEQLREFKTDLLKNTYKFDPATDPALYEKVNRAKEKLGVVSPVIVYQAQNTEEVNASIVLLNGEVHLVFSGKLLQLLSDEEMLAVIAHELSHVQLYTQLNGEIEVTDRIITAIANHHSSTPVHYETARLFKLYAEIFCDRGAYLVTGSYATIVSSLVKMSTGLQTVNADSYIKQAEEVFAAEADTKTLGISHPENFIRARAIWLWHEKGNEADPAVKEMIEGNTNLEELDLFKQEQINDLTEELIKLILQPAWMQTVQTISLGRQYFPGVRLHETVSKTKIHALTENTHSNLQDYLAYILYDFATTDKNLEDVPLGYCFALADELKLTASFAATLKKERKLTDKKITLLKKQVLAEFEKQSMQTATR